MLNQLPANDNLDRNQLMANAGTDHGREMLNVLLAKFDAGDTGER